MFFYWRIREELKELNEAWIFHDPAFQRNFVQWVGKHRMALSIQEGKKSSAKPLSIWPVTSCN
jgi:hypothetical protein